MVNFEEGENCIWYCCGQKENDWKEKDRKENYGKERMEKKKNMEEKDQTRKGLKRIAEDCKGLKRIEKMKKYWKGFKRIEEDWRGLKRIERDWRGLDLIWLIQRRRGQCEPGVKTAWGHSNQGSERRGLIRTRGPGTENEWEESKRIENGMGPLAPGVWGDKLRHITLQKKTSGRVRPDGHSCLQQENCCLSCCVSPSTRIVALKHAFCFARRFHPQWKLFVVMDSC